MQILRPDAAAGRFPLFALGRDPRGGHGLHAVRLRPLLAAFSLIDTAQIEVASSLGARPWRIVRQIILPAALPALLAGGSLCLLLTVNEFGIVLFIGAKGVITLPLLVYDKAIQEFDYTTACVIAVVNVGPLARASTSLYRFVLGAIRRPPCWSGLGPAAGMRVAARGAAVRRVSMALPARGHRAGELRRAMERRAARAS